MKKRIYLDNNATTSVDPLVVDAVTRELSGPPHNPSSIHSFGQEAKKILSQARKTIADFLDVKSSEILFTSSGTESMNLLIRGAVIDPQAHIIGSSVDHACVYNALQELQKKGANITFLGDPSPLKIKQAIRPTTRLIVLSTVNSETGSKIDIEQIASIAQAAKIPLVLDGVACIGKEPIKIPYGVSGMGFSAHKFHGPKGVGFIFVRSGFPLSPIIIGGNQERKLRSGTENLPGIVGMATAITLLNDSVYIQLKTLRDLFECKLKKALPSIEINGPLPRVSNTSNIYFPGVDGESLLIGLDMENIATSYASACSSGALEPSRVLLEMGMSKERVSSSLRFSFSRMNTEEEVHEAVEVIAVLVKKIRAI